MKQYIPYIVTAVLTFGVCILVDFLSRRRAKKKAAYRKVKPAKRTTFFGTILTFLGIVVLLFYTSKFGIWAIIGGSLILLLGLFMLLIYLCTGITYDESSCTCRTLGHRAKTLRYADITGQTALYTRSGVSTMLHFGKETVDVYESMAGVSDFLSTAYEGYLKAKGLTREEYPAPNPGSLLWFKEPNEE